MKYQIEHCFSSIKVNSIEVIGKGYDSVAYLVNAEYIFKMKFSTNKKKCYEKAKEYHDIVEQYYPIETIVCGISIMKKTLLQWDKRK